MKKVTEISDDALIRYAENSKKLKELESKIDQMRNEVERLCDNNNEILKTGKLPIYNSDDIPF